MNNLQIIYTNAVTLFSGVKYFLKLHCRRLSLVSFERFSDELHGGDLGACQLLFVSNSEEKNYARILETLGDSLTLTVSETESFVGYGGMISFVRDGKRVGFVINQHESNRVGLRIRSALLRKAKRVIKKEDY